jgi:DNA-binding transcriptional regulator YbjK
MTEQEPEKPKDLGEQIKQLYELYDDKEALRSLIKHWYEQRDKLKNPELENKVCARP